MFAFVLLLVFGAFWTWQTPGWLRGSLTPQEVDYHIGMLEQNLVMPAPEKRVAGKAACLGPGGRRPAVLHAEPDALLPATATIRRRAGVSAAPFESNEYYETAVARWR